MEVLVAVLIAFGVWVLAATGRLVALTRRHWVAALGVAVATVAVGIFVMQAPWAPPPTPADYSHGDATVRALIANP